MNELALFAGAGGGILGGHLRGWSTVCAVEQNPYAASVLAQRQNDGVLPPFPIWDDVCTFDGKPWRGHIDVVSGGFPCQDISSAGKGEGISGERSGLWGQMARIISEVQPKRVLVENSPLLIKRGLDVVLSDLAKIGYDAVWSRVSAKDLGAPHTRDRFWLVAYPVRGERWKEPRCREAGRVGRQQQSFPWDKDWEEALCQFRGMDDGLAYRVERIDTIRNGQVPIVAATAYTILEQLIGDSYE